jgi:hypothetical protein
VSLELVSKMDAFCGVRHVQRSLRWEKRRRRTICSGIGPKQPPYGSYQDPAKGTTESNAERATSARSGANVAGVHPAICLAPQPLQCESGSPTTHPRPALTRASPAAHPAPSSCHEPAVCFSRYESPSAFAATSRRAEEGDIMATAWFGPCPHCKRALSYLQGVTGSTMTPVCPSCRKAVTVTRATFLMVDNSRPSGPPKPDVAAPGSGPANG